MTSHTVCNHFTSILACQPLSLPTFGSQYISKSFESKYRESGIHYVVVPHTTQQPSKESNWNLQVAVAESTSGERMPVHSLMDVSHDPP